MNEELKAELIKKFTIESKGKDLACAYPPEKLIDWIDENFIQKSWSTSDCEIINEAEEILKGADKLSEQLNKSEWAKMPKKNRMIR